MARLIRFQYPGAFYHVMARGDGRKALLATVLRKMTTVGMEWISERLVMEHLNSVIRLIGGI